MVAVHPEIGAGDGTRTRDIDLGKVALYQLSYSRIMLRMPKFHFALFGAALSNDISTRFCFLQLIKNAVVIFLSHSHSLC